MPRSRTIPQATYPPGTYGPHSIDSFTNQNTDKIQVLITTAGLPTSGGPLFELYIGWDDGGEPVVFRIPAQVWVDKAGNPIPQAILSTPVPRIADGNGKAQVSSGSIKFVVIQTLTTAITIMAV